MSDAKWMDLHQNMAGYLADAHRRREVLGAAVAAEEEITLFGTRAKVTIEWPDGPPPGFTAESFREYARKLLQDLRQQG